MWIMLNDAFLSIVHKDCHRTELLVRARREGDIERIFPNVNVQRSINTDYLFRAVVPRHVVEQAIVGELRRVTYSNFKDTVADVPLHDAYLGVWQRMTALQDPPPFSGLREWRRHAKDGGRALSIEEEASVFATGHMPDDDLPAAPRRKRKPAKKAKPRRSLRKGR